MMDGDEEPGNNGNPDSVLSAVLAMCGVASAPQRPGASYTPFLLTHPPLRTRLLLESELPRNSDRPAQFLTELMELCSDATQLRCFLSPTELSSRAGLPPPYATRHTSSQADSVMRVCLNTLQLQRPLVDWMLEQLVANEDDWLAGEGIRASILSQRGLTSQSLPANSLPRLLIDQLRMLDIVYDSNSLCTKLQVSTLR